jgi:hypothetical protein
MIMPPAYANRITTTTDGQLRWGGYLIVKRMARYDAMVRTEIHRLDLSWHILAEQH